MELEQQQQNRKLAAGAQQALDDEKDGAKQMNQMILYAKCVTIRDSQLEEKVCFVMSCLYLFTTRCINTFFYYSTRNIIRLILVERHFYFSQKQIALAQQQEGSRLDMMMEIQRIKAIQAQEEIDKERY